MVHVLARRHGGDALKGELHRGDLLEHDGLLLGRNLCVGVTVPGALAERHAAAAACRVLAGDKGLVLGLGHRALRQGGAGRPHGASQARALRVGWSCAPCGQRPGSADRSHARVKRGALTPGRAQLRGSPRDQSSLPVFRRRNQAPAEPGLAGAGQRAGQRWQGAEMITCFRPGDAQTCDAQLLEPCCDCRAPQMARHQAVGCRAGGTPAGTTVPSRVEARGAASPKRARCALLDLGPRADCP